MEPSSSSDSAPRRAVLLGASNLTRAFSTAIETARRTLGGPLDIFAALGHGRSYGGGSRFLGRRLPGILQSGLWTQLDRRRGGPTTALVTDVGNDLMYGSSVVTVAGWVHECLDRLARHDARVSLTSLPVAGLPRLSERRFRLVRSLFVPSCDLSLSTLVSRAVELNARLREMAISRKIFFVEQPASWYWLDPIHHRIHLWPSIWREMLAPWRETDDLAELARASIARNLYLRSLAPERCVWLGWEQRRRQPTGRLRDGTTVSLY